MMKRVISGLSVSALAGTMLFASTAANAAEVFDGKSNFICATMDVIACVDGMICSKGQARDFEMPEFMTVDFKNKVINVTYDGGTEASSTIKNMEQSGNQLILQGVENDHGWSMAVHSETGRMSIGVVGHELSFSLFGACKVL
jgi:hypothetical protein